MTEETETATATAPLDGTMTIGDMTTGTGSVEEEGEVAEVAVDVTTTGTEGTMIGIPSEEVSPFCLACDKVFES
jgi:hypothetical protein